MKNNAMKNQAAVLTFLTCLAAVISAAGIGTVPAAPLSQNQQPEPPTLPDAKVAEYIAEKQKQLDLCRIPKDQELIIAVMPDAPPVTISGTVFQPDGSPAAGCTVDACSAAFVFSQKTGADGKMTVQTNSCGAKTDSAITITDEKGTFQLNGFALPGANVIVMLTQHTKNSIYLSRTFTFVAHEDMKPLEIRLDKGVPVHGKIMYDNGSPAAHRAVTISQKKVKPILGAALPAMEAMLPSQCFIVRTDADGEFECCLSPGDNTILYGKEQETLVITPFSAESYFNLTMPTPIFVEIEREDGTLPGEVDYRFVSGDGHGSLDMDNINRGDRPLIFNPVTSEATLHLVERNLEWGTIETLSPEMVGKTVRFKLKPMSNVTITLLDAAGKPMADKQIGLQYTCKLDDFRPTYYSTSYYDAFTDENGKAMLRVLPGKVTITLVSNFIPRNGPPQGQNALRRNESHCYTAATDLDLAPGETYDFGTVTVQ